MQLVSPVDEFAVGDDLLDAEILLS
jgi:hypothetical protein